METNCQKIELEATGAFPDLFLDYINQKKELASFYEVFPSIDNFEQLIQKKQFTPEKRAVLVQELSQQYGDTEHKPDLDILLEANTFTVTTGHQLNIFSGPLYIPFKIITIINLARELKKKYPTYNFVPVYWMATEDHDLEEIQSFSAFGQKLKWETNQSGAVGPMNTEGLAELASKLGPAANVFEKAYSTKTNLADAVRAYTHELFGAEGLVIIDANTPAFKREFIEIIREDLLVNTAHLLVNKQTKALESQGYKTQISPREINFFYLEGGIRERIVKENGAYAVLNTELKFTEEEMLALVDAHPERFSPNVVLRPLFEEVILPNLAYIGGPSEVPYWLQLKPIFDHFGVMFPALIPRNFALLLSEKSLHSCGELGLDASEMFLPDHVLVKNWVEKNSPNELSLAKEIKSIKAAFSQSKKKAELVDPTLVRTSEAFETKTLDLLESLEKKLRRAEKRKYKEAVAKIEKVKNTLFPGGGLQERKENIIPFLEQRKDLISYLLQQLEPLDFRFNLVKV